MAFFLYLMTEKKIFSTWLLFAILILTAATYWPGLDSGFYLDDFPNLASLSQIGEQGALPYILGGISSPLGRPLSLATFAIQYQAWPGNPFAFKLVNLVLHLINGCLIFFACRLLLAQSYTGFFSNRGIYFSLIVTALWLLHPIQQDTVLYTVQRMTELSALFTLSGYILYLAARKSIIGTNTLTVYLATGISVWILMVIAILSKENGILLPLFILITEFTLFHAEQRSGKWRIWAGIFLVLPLLLLAIYLLYGLQGELRSYMFRDYTATDRLLTEPGVLLLYLKNLLLPHLSAFSLFNDDYPVARGILSPPYVSAYLALLITILIVAVLKRRSFPVLCFGIIWFLGGHLLEASHLNLELFFDHRNYLPAFGIFFAMTWCLFRLYEKTRVLAVTGGGLYFILIIIITFTSSLTWADPAKFLQLAVNTHPHSVRARTYFLNNYIKAGDITHARLELHKIAGLFPDEIFPYLKEVSIQACIEQKPVTDRQWRLLKDLASNTRDIGFDNVSVLNNITYLVSNDYCKALDQQALVDVIFSLVHNDNFRPWRSNLYEIAANLESNLGHKDKMVQYIKLASEHSNSIPNKIAQIEVLLSINRHADAKELLYALEGYLDNHERLAIAWNKKVSELRQRVQKGK